MRLVDKGQRERNRRTEQQPVPAALPPRGRSGPTRRSMPMHRHVLRHPCSISPATAPTRSIGGPALAGTASEFLNYGFKARYELKEKTDSTGSMSRQAGDSKVPPSHSSMISAFASPTSGFIDRLTATGGIDRSITAIDTVSLFATSTRTSYEPSSGGTPFTDTLARGNWRRSLSSVAAINLSSEYELLEYGNAFNTQVQIFREQAAIRRHFVGGAFVSRQCRRRLSSDRWRSFEFSIRRHHVRNTGIEHGARLDR